MDNINLNITDDKVSNCNTTCRLVLKNLKQQINLKTLQNYKYECNDETCSIYFGILPLTKDLNNTELTQMFSNTKYSFNYFKIIYNPDIKIDSRTRLINTELFIYINLQRKTMVQGKPKTLHIYIPIIGKDFHNNSDFYKLLDNKNVDITDLYNTIFPNKHSFYFINLEEKCKKNTTESLCKDNPSCKWDSTKHPPSCIDNNSDTMFGSQDNILVFENQLEIGKTEYFKIKENIKTDNFSSILNYDNAYYSSKSNCLNNNIELPEGLLTEYLNTEKLMNNTLEENYDKSDNYDKDEKHDKEDVEFNWFQMVVNILIILFFITTIF